MKLRLRVIDENAEPLKEDRFYIALYRPRDQRREAPILRKAVLEQCEVNLTMTIFGTQQCETWSPVEVLSLCNG